MMINVIWKEEKSNFVQTMNSYAAPTDMEFLGEKIPWDIKSALSCWGPVMHVCVREIGHHWFRKRLVACSTPSHYLNQCWRIFNWTPRYKIQWHFSRNSNIFIQENAFEKVVCEMVAIFSQALMCLNTLSTGLSWYVALLVCSKGLL